MKNAIVVFPVFCLLVACQATVPTEVAEPPAEAPEIAVQVAFTEGPTVDADGNVYFTEMRSHRIMKWTGSGYAQVFREMENETNGLKFDADFRLMAAEMGGGRVLRMNLESGEVEVLAENSAATPIDQPNDLTFDSQGRIYFTSYGNSRIYRIDPDGTVTEILGPPDAQVPNGIVVSENDHKLYYVEANNKEGGKRLIMEYDLSSEGTLSNGRVFHDFYPGRSADGIAIDSEGSIYAAAGLNRLRGTSETLDTKAGIHVFNANGEQLAFHPIWEDTVTNCAFGGDDLKTLYVTAGKTLFSIRTDVEGTRR